MSLFATLSRSVALAVMLVITSPAALAQLAPTDEQRQAAVEIAEALQVFVPSHHHPYLSPPPSLRVLILASCTFSK